MEGMSINKGEMTDRIYDTLMHNTQMWGSHVLFDVDDVVESEVDREYGVISFKLKDGSIWALDVHLHTPGDKE